MRDAGLNSDSDWHTYQLDWEGTFDVLLPGRPESYLTVTSLAVPRPAPWVFGPGSAERRRPASSC